MATGLKNPSLTQAKQPLHRSARTRSAPRDPSRPYWRSLSARLLLVALVWVALFLIGGSVIFSQLFSDYLTDAMDDRLEQYMQVLIGSAIVEPDGQIRFERPLGEQRFTVPYSGYYWEIGAPQVQPSRSRSLWDQILQLEYGTPRPEPVFSMRYGPEGQSLRVLERDVNLPDASQPYRFLVTGNFDEVRTELKKFHRTLFWSMGLLGLGLMGAVAVQIAYGLRPLRRLRKSVAAIRSGGATRVPDDLPPEVMPLVGEMNALLNQNEETVERAKTQAGNLAHALKTPLSILTNEADRRGPSLGETVTKQVGIMRRHIDHNLARARAATHYGRSHMSADLSDTVATLVRVMAKLHPKTDIALEGPTQNVHVRAARQDLEEILGNIIENAAKFSDGRIAITLSQPGIDGFTSVVVEDNGPGIPQHQRSAIFTRGKRLDETVPGSGLGLSIVTDLLDIHGGTIFLDQSKSLGGLKVVLSFKSA